jgi:hypothetical protein
VADEKVGLIGLYRVADGSSFAWSEIRVEAKDPPIKALSDVNDRKIVLNGEGEPIMIDDENHPANGQPTLEFNENFGISVLS